MDRRLEWVQEKACLGLGVEPNLFEAAIANPETRARVTAFFDGSKCTT
jgi:dynein heavy chain